MKYKVGDKVKIKSLDWYNSNKDALGNIDCGKYSFIDEMVMYCGKTLTVECVHLDSYDFIEDLYRFVWTDDMIECLVEPAALNESSKMVSLDKACKYLEDVLYEVVTGVTHVPDVMSVESTTMEDFIKNFRKAMEE